MNKLWLTLFSALFFFSCITKTEVEDLSENELLIKQDKLKIIYNKTNGGHIAKATFSGKLAFYYVQETFPSAAKNFRSSKSSNIHDDESIVSRTFHLSPKLSVNRSFELKENALELNWRFKNTSQELISGKFQVDLNIDKNAKISAKENGTELTLSNGLKLFFNHSDDLRLINTKNGFTFIDKQTREIKPSHRNSETISISFLDTSH